MHSLLRVSLLAAWFWTSCGVFAQDAASFRTRNAGETRTFELDSTQIVVVRRAGRAGVGALNLPGSQVVATKNGRTTLKLNAPLDQKAAGFRRDAISRALPDAEIAPVLYEKGRLRSSEFRRVVTSNLLVKVAPGWSAAQIASAAGAVGMKLMAAGDRVLLTLPNGFAALNAHEALQGLGLESDLQLQGEMEKRFTPNDPLYAQQWHLRNNGRSNGVVGIDANVTRAHDFTKGAGVTIAVVDDCLETTHPDLTPNCPPLSSDKHHDFNDGDNNPAPDAYDGHGTSVGGVAAAKGNNNLGVSGAAPDAQLVGLRLISGPFSDYEGATAIYWRPSGLIVGVSNNSWGPYDGTGTRGPDFFFKQALEDAATGGRGGKGQVTVFAAGNGKQRNDNSNLDGYANSRFVLAVAACTNQGEQSYYSEPGANILVCAPSNGGTLGIVTTDVTGNGGYSPGPGEPADPNYTNSFGGTSSASPLTAGGVALLLSVNPNLGWRDVHEILASTARQIQPGDADWVINGGGFKFNHKFGGGMIDLTAAVSRAQDWQNLAPEEAQVVSLANPNVPATVPDANTTGITRSFDFTSGPNLRVEHVELTADISHTHRSDLEIIVTSPAGTRSVMIPNRPRPDPSFDDDIDYTDGGEGWSFTSTHHWGENSSGNWTVTLRDRATGSIGTLNAATLKLYGAREETGQRVSFEKQRVSAIENGGSATVRVQRVGSLSGAVSVGYTTSANGTATVDQDYTAISGTVEFSDGQKFAEISVPILDDTNPEGPEAIYLLLKDPMGAALGGVSLMQVDVVDDDGNFVSVRAPDAEARETSSSEPANTGLLTISRAAPDNSALTVHYTISGTAESGRDYMPLPAQAVIPAFETLVNIVVKPVDDGATEVGEPVILTLNQDANYTVGLPDSALVTIVDNDLQKVEITAPTGTVSEAGAPVSFRISRNGAYPDSLIVELVVSGTARPSIDYEPLPERVEIPRNATSVDVPLVPIDDARYTPNKYVVLALGNSSDYLPDFRRDARINIAENDPLPDTHRPRVTVRRPLEGSRIFAGQTVVASGSATDNGTVQQVLYRLNSGAWKPAEGIGDWSADLTTELVAGENVLQVRAVDDAENEGKIQTRTFTYVKIHTLNVTPGTGGAVSGNFVPSTMREAGKQYTVTAVPSGGFVFAGWSGDLASNSRAFTFIMPDADTSLVVSFVPNPFDNTITGSYSGLVRAEEFAFETSGFLNVTIGSSGSFTGSLIYGAKTYPLKGEFNGNGIYERSLARKGNPIPLALHLAVDLEDAQRVIGSVSTPDFSSEVTAERSAFNKQINPYTPASDGPLSYTLIFPPRVDLTTQQPRGNGVATMTINSGGTVKWKATLPDGSSATGSAALSKTRTWPFFLHAYKGKGVLLGEVTLDERQEATDLSGVLDWSKPPRSKDKLFPLGFIVEQTSLIGSLYQPPARGTRVLSGFDTAPGNTGTIAFREGNLKPTGFNREFTETFTLSTENTAAFASANPYRVKLKIELETGRFSGQFFHPFTNQLTLLKGVILQKQQRADGTFEGSISGGSGTRQTGTITVLPKPAP